MTLKELTERVEELERGNASLETMYNYHGKSIQYLHALPSKVRNVGLVVLGVIVGLFILFIHFGDIEDLVPAHGHYLCEEFKTQGGGTAACTDGDTCTASVDYYTVCYDKKVR